MTLDVAKIKCPQTNKDVILKLKNFFCALDETTDRDPDVDAKWEAIKKPYIDTSIRILQEEETQ